MLYAVDKYLDQIRTKKERETLWGGEYKYHYFETEDEARRFIVKRANDARVGAEKALVSARLRVIKCAKKFGWKF